MYIYIMYFVGSFISIVASTIPLFFAMSWILLVSMIVKSIVIEKETRTKEVVKVTIMTE